VLPGLKLLQLVDGGQVTIMDATFKTMVQSMINDITESNTPTTTSSTIADKEPSEKSTTRRNILGAASLTSLKVDFDKAIPKWTWKNR
jgi:hypothetical protein